MSDYRIEFSIQRCSETEDYAEIGFGSSGAWDSPDAAAHIVVSMIQNREWETTPGMPEPDSVAPS